MLASNLNNSIDQRPNNNPFAFATLVDEQGREIPITEEMIMKACDDLMELWQYPAKPSAKLVAHG